MRPLETRCLVRFRFLLAALLAASLAASLPLAVQADDADLPDEVAPSELSSYDALQLETELDTLKDNTVEEFAKLIGDVTFRHVLIDRRSLSDVGLSPDETIADYPSSKRRLSDTIAAAFDELELTIVPDGDSLRVMYDLDARERLFVRVYDVTDLIDAGLTVEDGSLPQRPAPQGGNGGGGDGFFQIAGPKEDAKDKTTKEEKEGKEEEAKQTDETNKAKTAKKSVQDGNQSGYGGYPGSYGGGYGAGMAGGSPFSQPPAKANGDADSSLTDLGDAIVNLTDEGDALWEPLGGVANYEAVRLAKPNRSLLVVQAPYVLHQRIDAVLELLKDQLREED